jgi:sugar phosphate isomerase/epimerase
VSPWPLADRVRVAAEAGFRGVGLGYPDLIALRDSIGFEEIRRILEAFDMRYCEFEVLTDWWTTGERRAAADEMRENMLEAIQELAVPHSHVKCAPDMMGGSWPLEVYAEAFAELAADTERAGAALGFEVFPFTDVSTPVAGLAVIEAAGRPRTGLILDIWHITRRGVPYEELERIPAERIVHVELNDADEEPVGSLIEDTIDNRRLCGTGSFEVSAFLAAIEATGYRGLYGVEILSREHRTLSLEDAAQRVYETTIAQFRPLV